MAEAIIIPYEKGTCGKMTKEEALKIWLPVISMGIDNMPELKEALEMAIEALEQEPVLGKIRAEIENIAFDSQEIDGEHESIIILELNDALEIIDKYKSESEERNEH